MLLFRAEAHVDRWCSQWNQQRGATLTIDQTWRLAQAWHSTKLAPDWRRATIEQTEALLDELGLTGAFWSLRA